jgi:hypothetical protein
VNGSWPVPVDVPVDVPVVLVLLAAPIVNGNDTVRLAPVMVSVWEPGSRPVGMTTAVVTLPVLSAIAVASVMVVECAAIVVDSPGVNPVPLMITV